jgi:alpha-mannosidase
MAPWQGQCFNRPLLAFETTKHAGTLSKELSLIQCNCPQVNVMAFKKMEEKDMYLVRVNEQYGNNMKNVRLTFPAAIMAVYEVNGQEQPIGARKLLENNLTFDIEPYGIKSFALLLDKKTEATLTQESMELPYDQDAMSYDNNRDDCNFNRRNSLPAECMPAEIVHAGVRFRMGSPVDGANNVLACNGQQIRVKEGAKKVYLLASGNNDVQADFMLGDKTTRLNIQKGSGYIGQFYNRAFAQDNVTVTRIDKPYLKKSDIAWFASHGHYAYPSRNEAYQYTYIYVYELEVPPGAEYVKLPVNPEVKVFAMTQVFDQTASVKAAQSLQDDFDQAAEAKLRLP